MIGPQEKLSVDLSQVVAISLVRPDGKAVARIALTQDIALLLPTESRVSLSLHTKARSILMVNTMPVGWPTRKKLLGVRKVISVVQWKIIKRTSLRLREQIMRQIEVVRHGKMRIFNSCCIGCLLVMTTAILNKRHLQQIWGLCTTLIKQSLDIHISEDFMKCCCKRFSQISPKGTSSRTWKKVKVKKK